MAATAALLLLLAPSDARAQAAEAARAWISADTVSVGDRFRYVIEFDRQEPVVAEYPDPARGDSVLGDLEVLEVSRFARPLGDGSGLVRDSVVYEVTTFALDSAYVPPQLVALEAGADSSAAETNAVVVAVRSLVPSDAEDIRDLSPILEFGRNWWPWVLAGLLVLLAIALIVYLVRRRRALPAPAAPPAPPEPPYVEAMRRLRALEAQPLTSDEEVKQFYVEASDVLRTYLERRLGYPALETTTRELMAILDADVAEGFPVSAAGRIQSVLHQADLVKFADARPPESAARMTASETGRAVDEVERHAKIEEAAQAAEVAGTA